MLDSFIPIIKIFLLCSAGFIAKKTKVMGEGASKVLSSLIVKITFPALIFTSLQRTYTPELLKQGMITLGIAFGLYGFFVLLSFIVTPLLRAPHRERGVYQFALVFANVAFMGFPVLSSIFGKDILFYAAMLVIPFQFLVYTLGIFFLSDREEGKKGKIEPKLILNPGIIATVIGFIFFIFTIKLPDVIAGPLKMIGDMTTPLSMIVIGALLSDIALKELFRKWRVYVISAVRLLVIPAIVYFLLKWIVPSKEILLAAVTLSAMPVGVNAPILAHQYGGDEILATRVVVISTLLSILTLPLLTFFLQNLINP